MPSIQESQMNDRIDADLARDEAAQPTLAQIKSAAAQARQDADDLALIERLANSEAVKP